MSAKLINKEGNLVTFSIEIDANKVNEGLDKAFTKVVKEVNVPGFRKGKMPRAIFEQRFGVESLYQDAVDILLPDAYVAAIEELNIDPVDRPEIDVENIAKGEALVITARVTVRPEVELGEYKGLEVEALSTEVTAEDVDAEIKAKQERFAELAIKEEGTIETGDTAVIDFEGFLNDVAFEGGKGEDFPLEIGSGSFIPGFEEQLVGVATGATVDVNVTFPEEYHAAELAGQPAVFKVTVKEIKAKQTPELTDEFAKEVDAEVDSVEQLKLKVRSQLIAQKQADAESYLQDQLVQKAMENAKIDLPEIMIENEIDAMVKDFEQRLSQQGLSMDMYFQFSGQTIVDLREQMKEEAESRVRVTLTLDAIAKAENLTATEEEVDAEIERMSAMYSIPADQVRAILANNMDQLMNDVKIKKAVDVLVQNAKIKA